MSRSILAFAALTAVVGLAAAHPATAPNQPMHKMAVSSRTDHELIDSAMRAAPTKVSVGATIVAPQPDGTMRVVRAGSNGFTCMADNPTTPGPDPMCMDAAASEWAGAWMGHKTPASRQGRADVHA
jgi:hypothetical protein